MRTSVSGPFEVGDRFRRHLLRVVVTGARRKAGSGAKGGYAEPPCSFSDECHKEASFIDFKSSSSSCHKYELDTYCCEDVATLPQGRCTVAPSDPTRTSLKINRKQTTNADDAGYFGFNFDVLEAVYGKPASHPKPQGTR